MQRNVNSSLIIIRERAHYDTYQMILRAVFVAALLRLSAAQSDRKETKSLLQSRAEAMVRRSGAFPASSHRTTPSHRHRRDAKASNAAIRSFVASRFERAHQATKRNFTDFYPGGKCNNRKNATWSPLTLLTTIPYIPLATVSAHTHINESMLALGENCRVPSIVEIHVVVDRFEGTDEEATKMLRENVYREQSKVNDQWQGIKSNQGWGEWERADPERELGKIVVHVFGQQPTYSDLFRYAEERLRDRTVGISNADIVLRNPEVIDHDSFTEAATPIALCISVSPPSDPYASLCRIGRTSLDDKCVDRQGRGQVGGSWDITIFRSPLVNPRYDLLDELKPTPVYMNQMAGEERAGYFLAMSGYRLYNPCTTLIAEHWHCSKIKTHHASFDLAAIVNDTTGEPLFNIRALAGGMVLTREDSPGIICKTRLSRTGGQRQFRQGRIIPFYGNSTLGRTSS